MGHYSFFSLKSTYRVSPLVSALPPVFVRPDLCHHHHEFLRCQDRDIVEGRHEHLNAHRRGACGLDLQPPQPPPHHRARQRVLPHGTAAMAVARGYTMLMAGHFIAESLTSKILCEQFVIANGIQLLLYSLVSIVYSNYYNSRGNIIFLQLQLLLQCIAIVQC
jgi:hypothetical protein